jgi:hypothetical protein
MTTRIPDPALRVLACLGLTTILAAAACTEPRRTQASVTAAVPELEARLDLSDSTPRAASVITVTVQMRGTAATNVASYTARVAYDSLGLQLESEPTFADSATRISNPQPGLIRIAGIAPNGFAGGRLYAVRFTVLKPQSLSSLRLAVDEMHTTAHADVSASVARVKP